MCCMSFEWEEYTNISGVFSFSNSKYKKKLTKKEDQKMLKRKGYNNIFHITLTATITTTTTSTKQPPQECWRRERRRKTARKKINKLLYFSAMNNNKKNEKGKIHQKVWTEHMQRAKWKEKKGKQILKVKPSKKIMLFYMKYNNAEKST